MDRSRIAVVIPALNESATIYPIVQAAGKYAVSVVVDDGSTDDTAAQAKKAGAIVVYHDKNYGYDAALNTGFKKAAEIGCEIIITLDADGQHDPSLIQQFIDAIDGGADVVCGVRSERQRIAENIFSWYTTALFGINDPLCGMKAYRTYIYRLLGHFDSHGSIGTELLLYAAKNRFYIAQIPFIVKDRTGKSRFGQVIIGNYKIIRAILISIMTKD